MIITRSPLRISLGGGGTDLPSYYSRYGGFLIAGAIDKYVYITLHDTFQEEIIIKYSQMEKVHSPNEIKHSIIRESLKLIDRDINYIEIASLADIPEGTGLGSSGAFTCSLLKALHCRKKEIITPTELAEEACSIEIDILGEPIGKQDQYISAHGGINCFSFEKDGKVIKESLKISSEIQFDLEDNLLLFFTGYTRSASNLLKDQDDKVNENNSSMIDNLHFIKELGYKSKEALERADLYEFARLMNVHWEYKKERTKGMSNGKINKCFEIALNNGALGGKLIGAGGGGFLMFYSVDNKKLRRAMKNEGLEEVRFKFDFDGSQVVTTS